MSHSIAPSREDLTEAYRSPDPNQAGHQQAEAVVVDGRGITVLCSANPDGQAEESWLLRLADDGSLSWEQRYPQAVGRALAAVPGGDDFVLAGDVRRGLMEYQGGVLRVGSRGALVARAWSGPRGVTGFTSIAALSVDSFVAGGTAQWKGWLMRLDGGLHATKDSAEGFSEDVHGLAPLGDGGFAAAETTEKSTTGFGRARLSAFTAEGTRRWRAELPDSGRGELVALVAVGNGGVAAVGHHAASDGAPARLWIVRLDGQGVTRWQRQLGPDDEERRGRAIARCDNGDLAVAGDGLREGSRGFRVARLSDAGSVLWERSYGGEGQQVARGLAGTKDGGLVVVGSTTRGPGRTNVWILRLNGQGEPVWDRVFGTAPR